MKSADGTGVQLLSHVMGPGRVAYAGPRCAQFSMRGAQGAQHQAVEGHAMLYQAMPIMLRMSDDPKYGPNDFGKCIRKSFLIIA